MCIIPQAQGSLGKVTTRTASFGGDYSTLRRYPAVTQPDFESVAQTVSLVVRLAAVKKWHDDCTRNNLYRSLDYAQTSHDKSTTIFNLDNGYFWDVGAPRKSSRPLNSSPCSDAHALDHARSFHFATPRNQQKSAPITPPQPLYPHCPPVSSNLYITHTIRPISEGPVGCSCSIFTALFSARLFRLRFLICSR